jgi:predicted transcriptional regulator
MKYRSRTEIVSEVLKSASDSGATKTKIMYKAFLSYAQLLEYLAMLTENELLSYNQGDQTVKTTQKGYRFLKIHDEIDDLMIGEEAKLLR